MQPSSGILAQHFAATSKTPIDALVLISGFIQRSYRPGLVACAALAATSPVRSFKHPLGYLQDGKHDCSSKPNTVSFPIPVLTIGGELDGIVRLGRFAEASHVQRADTRLPVVVIPGMTHTSMLATGLFSPLSGDIPATLGADPEVVRGSLAQAFGAFLKTVVDGSDSNALSKLKSASSDALAPLVTSLVDQEGSWYMNTGDDEHGASSWAAAAQQSMCDPLPQGWTWGKDASTNHFHLLSDEDKIPPYYRGKHRANVTLLQGKTLQSSTVSQLRYIEISVTQAGIGLNGNAIIKEEKCNVLNEIKDDGAGFVSAIEIGTKLASRQLAYSRTGQPAPDSLDDGNRCAAINKAAYSWALAAASKDARERHEAHGMKMRFVNDEKPTPPAGPWWIWNYLQYKPNHSTNTLDVSSWYAFYPLSGLKYGAGNHYCKLLSPARAMEWIYTASLIKS